MPPSLPTPLDFQDKIKNFCHPILLKIRFKITVTPPSKNGQSQNYGASINLWSVDLVSGLLSLKLLLHVTISFIKENHFNYCI